MKRMKRMASTLLAGVLALSLLPISSLAADSTDNDIQEMVVDGVTYFNANSEHFDDSNRLFFQDLLSNQNANLQDEASEDQTKKEDEETPVPQSTASLWQYLAYAIQGRNRFDSDVREAKSRLAWLDIALPQRSVEKAVDLFPVIFRRIADKEISLSPFSVTSTLPSLMNGGKDFSLWSRKDDAFLRKWIAAAREQASIYPDYLMPWQELTAPLSATELQVLRLICANKSNAEIGAIP